MNSPHSRFSASHDRFVGRTGNGRWLPPGSGPPRHGFSYRWWITAPGNDEALRSLFERADRLYGAPPENTYVWQDHGSSRCCLDAPTSRELLRLSRMLGMPARQLVAHRLMDHPALLDPDERRAYCPQCIQDDRAAGRPRVFRRAWARFFLLRCPDHNVPLQWAEPRLAAIAAPALHQALEPPGADEAEILRLVDTLAQTLEACLWRGQSWPACWRGNTHAARALLIHCLCNLTGEEAAPAAAQLWISPALSPWITFPIRPVPPAGPVPWDSVRRVGRPAWRRAALWMTAWQVIPALPVRLRPQTIPEAYLDDSDRWWEQQRPSPHTQKSRRVYATLRNTCRPFPVNEA